MTLSRPCSILEARTYCRTILNSLLSEKSSTPRPSQLRHEQVADLLRGLIAEMRLRPGERLVERELVELTGVSRSTVREAIRQLAAEGLVATMPQRGAVVAIPTPRAAAELYEIRAMLEGLAAQLFVRRAREDQVSELRRAFEEIEEQVAAPLDSGRMLRAKNRFYEVLLAGADNITMEALLRPLQTRISALRATSMSQTGRAAAALDEIRAIVEAIEARDEDAAFRASARHVHSAARSALDALASMHPPTDGDQVPTAPDTARPVTTNGGRSA